MLVKGQKAVFVGRGIGVGHMFNKTCSILQDVPKDKENGTVTVMFERGLMPQTIWQKNLKLI